jgi:uncharacterized protein (DUF1330 family)
MSVYMVLEIVVHDPLTYAKYVERVPAVVEKFGGRYLVRGGQITSMEGDWNPDRVVILEFSSLTSLRNWYESSEYRELALLRAEAAESRAFVVEGYQPS